MSAYVTKDQQKMFEKDRERSDVRERMDILPVCVLCASLHCIRAGWVALRYGCELWELIDIDIPSVEQA
jgi:hypothetical protein